MLITLEGLDGSGKTTITRKLEEEYGDSDHDFVFTREPTESWLGDGVRRSIGDDDSSPLTDFFLFAADHADHLKRTIKPALEDGKVVVSDRYIDSRYAYQGTTLDPYFEDSVEWLRSVHDDWTIYPDLTILLDISPEEAVKRKHGETMKYEETEFLRRVREKYDRLASESERYVRIDGERDSEEVFEDCVNVILSRI